jgi:hypothetical protein
VKFVIVPWQTLVKLVEMEMVAVMEGETVTAMQAGALL